MTDLTRTEELMDGIVDNLRMFPGKEMIATGNDYLSKQVGFAEFLRTRP